MKIKQILKRFKLDGTSRDILIGIAIVILIGSNILISGIPFILDLSRGKAYSLSPSTISILRKVKEPVEISFFVSDNIPSSFLTTKNQVSDLLTEYRKGSSNVSVKIIDPKKDKNEEKIVSQEFGIQETQFSQMENDQFAVSTGYFSLGVKVKDNKSSIQRIDPLNLEYNISSIIYKMTQGQDASVGVYGGEQDVRLMGQGQGGESINILKQILSQQMDVKAVDLTTLSSPPKTLVILDSQTTPLDDKATKGLEVYLASGGKVILFTSGMQVSDSLTATKGSSNLKNILDSYGIQIQDDLVLSGQSEIVNFGSDATSRMVAKYPYWLNTNVFNSEASYTSNVNYLTFPWVSSIILTKRSGVVQKEIVRSTPQSWILSGTSLDLKPQSIVPPNKSQLKQYILIAYAKDQKTKGEMMVIPSTRFVQDAYLGRSGNLEFIVNLVNEFASDGALSGIRARAITTYPLPSLDANAKDVFKWANVLVLPMLFGLFGLLRLRSRGKTE